MYGWDHADPQIRRLPLDGSPYVAVLGKPLFRNVHIRHDLHTGKDHGMVPHFHSRTYLQPPVCAHPHGHLLLSRLQMDIAGLFPEPQGQQMVYKLHRHVFSAFQAL